MTKAVVILSGGLDSSTLLYYVKKFYKPDELVGLNFHYGQKHEVEIASAMKICEKVGATYDFISMAHIANKLFKSSLTDSDMEIPEVHARYEKDEAMKSTVVPYRNGVFLSMAVAYAISRGFDHVFYGAHYSDHGLYPDCRVEFVNAFETAAQNGTGSGIKIVAPFIRSHKSAVVQEGYMLNVPFELTWSCYRGGSIHCGKCGSCVERKLAFKEAQVPDPTQYEE